MKTPLDALTLVWRLTGDAKDVSDVWDEDHQQVDGDQETQGDGDVTQPMKRFPWKQQLQEGTTDLKNTPKTETYTE